MGTLRQLWTRRERPTLLSRRWLICWGKRVLHFPALVCLLLRHQRLIYSGAAVGEMVVLESFWMEGAASNLRIGAGSFIGRDCELSLHERISIGEQVVINRGVRILTASHLLRDPQWRSYTRPITVEDRAWIATGAMLLPGVTIGRGAVVGAGAVVRCNVPPHALAVGNPATITAQARTTELIYDTAHFPAPFEAWVGMQRPSG